MDHVVVVVVVVVVDNDDDEDFLEGAAVSAAALPEAWLTPCDTPEPGHWGLFKTSLQPTVRASNGNLSFCCFVVFMCRK